MADVKKGSCLCGEIQFECIGDPFEFGLCHCSMCRKFSGGPFGSFVSIKKDNFKYVKGKELETAFPSSSWASRSFCSKCGSSLRYLYHKNPNNIIIGAGLFDDHLNIKPRMHIFVKDKCSWFDITDDLPQKETY